MWQKNLKEELGKALYSWVFVHIISVKMEASMVMKTANLIWVISLNPWLKYSFVKTVFQS